MYVCICSPQGVINLESLGKRGYRVPPSGTIQVVRKPFHSNTVHHRLKSTMCPEMEKNPPSGRTVKYTI